MKKHIGKIAVFFIILAVLTVSFFLGGNNQSKSNTANTPTSEYISDKADKSLTVGNDVHNESANIANNNVDYRYSSENGMKISEETGTDKYLTEPVPEGKPVPIEPESTPTTEKELFCTLSVKCDTINNNLSLLNKDKKDLVPKDGIIFKEKKVAFYEGESVFDLLLREMKNNKIHMEFSNTPIYNSAYIEGIANLYEFDCGELSGWMYKVNDWFPNYGCSRYKLKNGDRVEWVYTCDLGADVGGKYTTN